MFIPIPRDARHKRTIGGRTHKITTRITRGGQFSAQRKVFEIFVLDLDSNRTKMFVVFMGLPVGDRPKQVATGSALVHLALVLNFLVAAKFGRGVELFSAVLAIDRARGNDC